MSLVFFISHPEVTIDRQTPVPEWDLAPRGRERLAALLHQPWLTSIGALFSSTERKARTTAAAIAAARGLPAVAVAELGEMDRSSTGMLEPEAFEQVVSAFFARPHERVRGWERAVDAQRRIVAAVDRLLAQTEPGAHIALCSHGGVGALLLCHLKGVPIARAEDQPGQGHYFVFSRSSRALIHGWHPIDAPALPLPAHELSAHPYAGTEAR